MPLVARDLIAGGPLVYGVLLGAFGIGAVVGALANGPLRRRLSNEWIVRSASLGLAVGTAAVGTSSVMPVSIVALMLAGVGRELALSTVHGTVHEPNSGEERQSGAGRVVPCGSRITQKK